MLARFYVIGSINVAVNVELLGIGRSWQVKEFGCKILKWDNQHQRFTKFLDFLQINKPFHGTTTNPYSLRNYNPSLYLNCVEVIKLEERAGKNCYLEFIRNSQ